MTTKKKDQPDAAPHAQRKNISKHEMHTLVKDLQHDQAQSPVAYRRQKSNQSFEPGLAGALRRGRVTVAARCRPPIDEDGECTILEPNSFERSISYSTDPSKRFVFDHVLGPTASQALRLPRKI